MGRLLCGTGTDSYGYFFFSILGVLEKSVKQDVYQADQLVLNTVKKELDTCFYSIKMTYLKLEFDTNLRKLITGSLPGREQQLQTASAVLSRIRETTVFDGLDQKIYITLPDMKTHNLIQFSEMYT